LIIKVLARWKRHLKPQGHLILSGILRGQEKEVAAALRAHRFSPLVIRRRGKWIALLATRASTGKALDKPEKRLTAAEAES
jgi:ribosomal protein L11 methylase PrmA